jgi:hypothetical protein
MRFRGHPWCELREWQDAGVRQELHRVTLDHRSQRDLLDRSRAAVDRVSVRADSAASRRNGLAQPQLLAGELIDARVHLHARRTARQPADGATRPAAAGSGGGGPAGHGEVNGGNEPDLWASTGASTEARACRAALRSRPPGPEHHDDLCLCIHGARRVERCTSNCPMMSRNELRVLPFEATRAAALHDAEPATRMVAPPLQSASCPAAEALVIRPVRRAGTPNDHEPSRCNASSPRCE